MLFVNLRTTSASGKRSSGARWLAVAMVLCCVGVCPWAGVPAMVGQSSPQQPAQNTNPQSNGIPDAPSTVQPPAATPAAPEASPIPKPEEKKAVERDPWTNQPINKPPDPGSASDASSARPGDSTSTPPPMPPVRTVPQGTAAKQGPGSQQELYTLVVRPTFVQLPVTVKDRDGRMVDG